MPKAAPKTTDRRETADLLRAVGEETRIDIIVFLAGQPDFEANVTAVAEAVRRPVVNVSHHLRLLQTAGVLTDRKAGRHVVYGLSRSSCRVEVEYQKRRVWLTGPGAAAEVVISYQ